MVIDFEKTRRLFFNRHRSSRYPNARQYKTVASALVKSYPFLESSTDGGEVSDIDRPPHVSFQIIFQGAWIDGIKGKFKRGRRTATSYADAAQALAGENGYDRMSGDEELGEEKVAQTSNGQKTSHDTNSNWIPMMDNMNPAKCPQMATEKML